MRANREIKKKVPTYYHKVVDVVHTLMGDWIPESSWQKSEFMLPLVKCSYIESMPFYFFTCRLMESHITSTWTLCDTLFKQLSERSSRILYQLLLKKGNPIFGNQVLVTTDPIFLLALWSLFQTLLYLFHLRNVGTLKSKVFVACSRLCFCEHEQIWEVRWTLMLKQCVASHLFPDLAAGTFDSSIQKPLHIRRYFLGSRHT